MTLETAEVDRLKYLIGKQRLDVLTLAEEDELRSVLTRENPEVRDVDLERLVQFGLLLIGGYLLYELLTVRKQAA